MGGNKVWVYSNCLRKHPKVIRVKKCHLPDFRRRFKSHRNYLLINVVDVFNTEVQHDKGFCNIRGERFPIAALKVSENSLKTLLKVVIHMTTWVEVVGEFDENDNKRLVSFCLDKEQQSVWHALWLLLALDKALSHIITVVNNVKTIYEIT